MNFKAFLNTVTLHSYTLPMVILYVTEGCNLRCQMCSYREPLPNELSLSEIKSLAKTLVRFGLRHIVYSGGEPLLRRDFPDICKTFYQLGIKQTLLTNGLLLEKRLNEVRKYFSEIIVSLDGANAVTHNKIRGVESYDIILKGIQTAVQFYRDVSIRTVIQKQNLREIIDMVKMTKSLGVKRISFLAADVTSNGFGRDTRGTVVSDEAIKLDLDETTELRQIIEKMTHVYKDEFQRGFISESPEKLFHISQYFEALNGKSSFPRNHCNAPMVSAVITSTGDIQPCFFLPAYGSIRSTALKDLVNNENINSTRREVRNYSLERCQKCVCTLNVNPTSALLDRF